MSSIRDRIAALNASAKGAPSSPSAASADQSPTGTILYTGVLGKFGSGHDHRSHVPKRSYMLWL